MPRIAILTDSIACLTREQKEKYGIEVIPVNLMFEGKIYKNGEDLSASEAYQFLEKNPEGFATSAPSPGDFLEAYRKAALKTDKILCFPLSSKLSATYNGARIAKDLAKTELPQLKIGVIDTLTVGAGQALLAIAAARAAKEGKSFEEIIELVENLKKRVRVFLVLETIRHVYRTGRIPEVASKIGGKLPLKPILSISNGEVHFAGAASSKQKGVEKLLKILRESLDQKLTEIGVMHADCLKEAEELKEKIASQLPSAQIFITEFSPIMGYATGRGTLGIAFYSK